MDRTYLQDGWTKPEVDSTLDPANLRLSTKPTRLALTMKLQGSIQIGMVQIEGKPQLGNAEAGPSNAWRHVKDTPHSHQAASVSIRNIVVFHAAPS